MARFSLRVAVASGTNVFIWCATSTLTVHMKMAHYTISSYDSPNNFAGRYQIVRSTNTGTTPGPAITPRFLGFKGGQAPASALTPVNAGPYVTNPTFTDIMHEVAVNMQATYQWWANPYYEIEADVGTSNGLGLLNVAWNTGTQNIASTAMWEE